MISFGKVDTNGNDTLPDLAAMLDIKSTTKGILPPPVSLSSTSSPSPVSSPASGLIVYNTATTGDVTPGYYYLVGSVSADWNTATNWSQTRVPVAQVDVIIPATAPNMPIVNVPGLSCYNILIQDGATLTIDPGIVLTVNGNITVEGH